MSSETGTMTREVRRLGILVLAMFVALFTSTTIIQAVNAEALGSDPRNTRALYNSFSAERGQIIVQGLEVALSVPSNDDYQFQRQYPLGPMYAPVTGYFTLNQGNTGIEGAMNPELTGTANSQFLRQLEALLTGQDPKGSAVSLTISHAAQAAAYEALGDREGAVVAIDPATGDVLTMVSTPSFDPNVFADHNSSAVIEAYNQMAADPSKPLQNRAIGGDLYHPGSVFKLVVAAAALESGDYTLDSEFDNPATLQLPGSTSVIRNASRDTCGPGEQATLSTAITLSCNIPFALLASELGEDAIREQAVKMGYGQRFDIPMAVSPSIYPEDMDSAQLMLSAFGQYDVRTTPMQIAMTTAAIANGGTLMQPNLIDQVIAQDLSIVADPQPSRIGEAMSPATAEALQEVMIEGVTSGIATNAAISGVTVGGKTGTAENGLDANGQQRPFNLWFTGFGESNGQSVAVAVVVVPDANVSGQTSNVVAAPIGKAVIEAVLNQ
ncbi:penicillin-binding transpeptidase domain-containing protein [Humidisolicoccus flavus]|uniref:penicillin-binding transpeptidase domain-containing protein n=1 Tax=Humidisolicoccus flavus TaxID=3111414 RepID=UPI0032569851